MSAPETKSSECTFTVVEITNSVHTDNKPYLVLLLNGLSFMNSTSFGIAGAVYFIVCLISNLVIISWISMYQCSLRYWFQTKSKHRTRGPWRHTAVASPAIGFRSQRSEKCLATCLFQGCRRSSGGTYNNPMLFDIIRSPDRLPTDLQMFVLFRASFVLVKPLQQHNQ